MLGQINKKLTDLDIERNFYALILIEEGKGMLTQQELAEGLVSCKVSVVRIIDYLSENGYVKRKRDKTDKRKYRLVLTPKAEDALPKIKEAITDVTHTALKGFSPEKINEFYNILLEIENNLNKE
jgi:MarR family transcriptional regulator, transcriptional regulator for hemolysin